MYSRASHFLQRGFKVIVREILDRSKRRKRAGVLLFLLVFSLELAWIGMRDGFRGYAQIDIGGFGQISDASAIKTEPVESVNRAELFVTKVVMGGNNSELAKKCTVAAINYDTENPRLDVWCKATREEDARKRVDALVQPVLDRHRRIFESEQLLTQQLIAARKEQAKRLDQRIESLWKQSLDRDLMAYMLRDTLVDLEAQRTSLHNEINMIELRRKYHRPSELTPPGITVTGRFLGWAVWAMISAVAIFSGVLSAVLLATGDLLRDQGSSA